MTAKYPLLIPFVQDAKEIIHELGYLTSDTHFRKGRSEFEYYSLRVSGYKPSEALVIFYRLQEVFGEEGVGLVKRTNTIRVYVKLVVAIRGGT